MHANTEPNSTTETLDELCRRVTCRAVCGARLPAEERSQWQQSAHDWRVTLRYQGRTLNTDYWMGAALTHAPTALEVMESLLLDAQCGAMNYADFLSEFDYENNADSVRLYRACARTLERLEKFLANDFARFEQAERE